jgi:hypothetical protein
MGLAGLGLFMAGIWIMILGVAAFLAIFVARIEIFIFHGEVSRLTVSAVQAAIAIVVVIALVFGLSRMKRIYMRKKLP